MKLKMKIDGKWFNVSHLMKDDMSMYPADMIQEISTDENVKVEEAKPKYTDEQLHAAFDKVKNKRNWKNPIDALVETTEDMELINEAIIHFAGSPMDYVKVKRGGKEMFRVRAAGYYACIGA